MTIEEIFAQFVSGMRSTGVLEYIAVVAAIGSVYFSRIENVLVYPIGLISTTIYFYLSYKYHLPGEAVVNFYYTVMSIYGWYCWSKKSNKAEQDLKITYSDKKLIQFQLMFFVVGFFVIYLCLVNLKKYFFDGAIPWADALASAAAFTGMWLMARKKVESWHWWLITNIISIPLYFVKGLVFTSVLFLILFIFAIFGLIEWKKRAAEN